MARHRQTGSAAVSDDLELLSGRLEDDDDSSAVYDLVSEQVRFRQNPVEFLELLRKHYLGTGWRSYDNYIGARIFYKGWRDKTLKEIMHRPIVAKCIEGLVDKRMDLESDWGWTPKQRQERRNLYTDWVKQRTWSIGEQAMPYFETVSKTKLCYFVVAQIFSRCYHQGLHISQSDIERVRAKAKELEARKESLLIFPCHKSHIDYMSLVFTFFRLGLSLPATIAGENLDVTVLHSFLRDCGATYIRRGQWSNDPLYSSFFQGLIETFLREGMNFQCFIEGTRSRTGKLLPPKFGILKFILETILNGSVKDAWVLPVSTQYDKVVEADSYATELLGREKKSESLRSFVESSSIMSLQLGRVDVRFGEIWSLREFVLEHLQLDPTVTFPLEKPLTSPTRTHLLRAWGYRILSDINSASAIMPSALVGTALLTTVQRGISREQLIYRVSWLIERVIEAGGNVGALHKDASQLTSEEVASLVDNALSVLGPELVAVESRKLLEPVYSPKDEFKLSYYRNQVVFLFISRSIVTLAIYSLVRKDYVRRISRSELERKVRFLSALLAGEFVYNPEGLQTNLDDTLQVLVSQEVISMSPDGSEITVNMFMIQTGMRVFDFYAYLVWPFIDGYWSVMLSLFALPPSSAIKEREFYKMAQSIARTLYAQGELSHPEALNQEMIKFAVQSYITQGIVSQRVDDDGVSFIAVAPAYEPQMGPDGRVLLEGPLYDICEEIALSRNKPLRYGITQNITHRLLDLCQPVAASLCVPRI